MQIVIFILIATIIELLLPNNSMKRYVNIVVGLLLLLIFSKPLMLVFSLDVNSSIKSIEQGLSLESNQTINQENIYLKQKNEIQAEQDAYILNEIKQQLIQRGNLALVDQFTLKIIEVEFSFIEASLLDSENIDQVTVHLIDERDLSEVRQVEPIRINPEQLEEKKEHKQLSEIKNVIATAWDIEVEMLTLVIEGGTS